MAVFTDTRRQEYISQLWDLASESDVNWRFRLLLAQFSIEIFVIFVICVLYHLLSFVTQREDVGRNVFEWKH